MEWLAQLRGQIVGLDTAPLIYFVEENPDYTALVDPFFEALDLREFRVVTSVITLTEVLVYPMRARDTNLAQQYRDILFDQENMSTVLVSPQIAELAAEIRATYNLRTPDAIQLFTNLLERQCRVSRSRDRSPNHQIICSRRDHGPWGKSASLVPRV